MHTFEKHFLLDTDSVKEYVVNKVGYFKKDESLKSCEIGDGNINYVFKVVSETSGRSIVVKQADKFLRSSGRPLDVYRSKIEAEILKIEGELAKEYVPQIYYYDDIMCTLCMEDISLYKNLRNELAKDCIYPGLGENISDFMAKVLLPTTDLVMDKAIKKDKVKKFCNIELCDISEDLVLCEPYFNYKDRNIITEGNEAFVAKHLYNNDELKAEVLKLRNIFMNQAQALIHGDLHSGSIFINKNGIKIIDPEFAFYGPMGYDIGNVIGNLFFAWANSYYLRNEHKDFHKWIAGEIEQTIDVTMKKLSEIYDEKVKFEFYRNEIFKKAYLRSILNDSLGFAGTEIIRRVVGDSKVSELTSIQDKDIRIKVEQKLIEMGIYLIVNRESIMSGKEISEKFSKIIL